MSGDRYDLREIGGAELERCYPDCGPIAASNWYNAVLRVDTTAGSWWGWLRRLAIATHAFGAVLSARRDGLRVLVLSERLAVFIPWAEAVVSAARGTPGTVVRLTTAGLPGSVLVLHLDDFAVDDAQVLLGQR